MNGGPVALVLGAGGVKGWAHVGVVKVLDRAGVPIDLILGASAGALMGPLYAVRRDVEEMEAVARSASPLDLLEWFLHGLRISPEAGRFGRRLWQTYGRFPLEEMAVPFAAVALDVATGERVVIRSGSAAAAVEVSIRPPVILPVLQTDGRHLVDGGLHNTVPVDLAYALGAAKVIAVNVGEFFLLPPPLRPLSAMTARACRKAARAPHDLRGQFAFMADLLSKGHPQRPAPDVLIRPDLRGFRSALPLRMNEAIRRGEAAARAALPAISRALEGVAV
ncbi:MAG: patatin-like phospholipase family protein [Chloroflexi bacterium]|nr:patatin-like phospholipase family protein [Chloroflexota bacterium]